MSCIALIDDHESVRLGLAAALEGAGFTVVFSGAGVGEYLTARRRAVPTPADVVLLDLTLGDGTTVTENVTRLVVDGSSVVIHSVADRPAAVREALAAGAAGVISKSSPLDDVLAAVTTVARGEALNNVEWASAVEGDRAFADAQLSGREREVLRLYATGLPLKVVAERLGVAYSTAKENITRIRVKYVDVGRPAPTKVDLLRRAMEDGILTPPQDSVSLDTVPLDIISVDADDPTTSASGNAPSVR